jgi:hypothetical protein
MFPSLVGNPSWRRAWRSHGELSTSSTISRGSERYNLWMDAGEIWAVAHNIRLKFFEFHQHNVSADRHPDEGSSSCVRFCCALMVEWLKVDGRFSHDAEDISEGTLRAMLTEAVIAHDEARQVDGNAVPELVRQEFRAADLYDNVRISERCVFDAHELAEALSHHAPPFVLAVTVVPASNLKEICRDLSRGVAKPFATGDTFCILFAKDVAHVLDSHEHWDVYGESQGMAVATASPLDYVSVAQWIFSDLLELMRCDKSQMDVVFVEPCAPRAADVHDVDCSPAHGLAMNGAGSSGSSSNAAIGGVRIDPAGSAAPEAASTSIDLNLDAQDEATTCVTGCDAAGDSILLQGCGVLNLRRLNLDS